jgi:hypothetical protein
VIYWRRPTTGSKENQDRAGVMLKYDSITTEDLVFLPETLQFR